MIFQNCILRGNRLEISNFKTNTWLASLIALSLELGLVCMLMFVSESPTHPLPGFNAAEIVRIYEAAELPEVCFQSTVIVIPLAGH